MRQHQEALNLTGGNYDAATHDLQLVKDVKSGKRPLDP
jgi:hypothetical protein